MESDSTAISSRLGDIMNQLASARRLTMIKRVPPANGRNTAQRILAQIDQVRCRPYQISDTISSHLRSQSQEPLHSKIGPSFPFWSMPSLVQLTMDSSSIVSPPVTSAIPAVPESTIVSRQTQGVLMVNRHQVVADREEASIMSRIWQRQIEIDDEDLADQLQRISISSSIENRLDSVDQCVKSLMTEKKESTVDEGVVKDVVDSLVDNFLLEELFIHKKFAQLDESRIAQIFTTPRNVVHVSKHNQELTTEMIMCLRDGVWLNDEVINFHISMMQERNSKSTTSPVIFFHNSFFYCKLVSNGRYCYSNVSRWTKRKKVDIFACDIVMFPVHVHGNHWCLGAFDFRSKEIRYYDSLGGRNSEFFIHSRAYIKDEHQDKKGRPIELSDWKDVYPPKIPQQRNGCDCGVFALKFADFLSEDLPLSFSQTDMPYFRRRMILEITSGSIL